MRLLTRLAPPVACIVVGLALPVSASAATGSSPPARPATVTAAAAAAASPAAASKGHAIAVPIPGTGRTVKVAYAGPIAPWKVLNPFRHDERQSSVEVMGASSSHAFTMHTANGPTGRSARVGYASTNESEGGATRSRKIDVSAGPTGPSSSERSLLAEQVHVDPQADRRVVQRLAGTSTTTRSATGAKNQVDQLELSDERANARTGVTNKSAVGLERVRADRRDDMSLRAGHTREEAGGKTQTEGVVVRRDEDGNVSTQILRGGPERVRTLTHSLDPESRPHRNVFGRIKDAVIGKKTEGAFDEHGMPEQR